MAEKKNHHFVPQSYQRLFSNDGKSIGVYNIKKNFIVRQSSIKNTMSKDYFYSKDQNVEDALAEIEKLCIFDLYVFDKNFEFEMSNIFFKIIFISMLSNTNESCLLLSIV